MKNNLYSSKAITLIALIVTIIILLILAGVSISTLGGENGIITQTIKAKEETETKEYAEKIELIKTELQLENRYKEPLTLVQLQERLSPSKEKWVASIEPIMDKDVEKLQLTTKEGYIFYITGTTTEYKGKGKVVDTSALGRLDVISLIITNTTTENGKMVQITDLSGVDYYTLKYKIGEQGEWQEINSGETVELPHGETIFAKLVYGSREGEEHKVSLAHTKPTVVAKSEDTTNITRKTDKSLAELFEITWGSDGSSTNIEYTVTGNLTYNNISFSNTEIENISELELGTYTVTCKITSPTNQEASTTKNVKITTLATTTVTNVSNASVTAKAIYSQYDLAYFRDLVNGGQFTINAKLMNDIDLTKVCSATVGSWIPIGEYNSLLGGQGENPEIYFDAILDGNNKKIQNLYIDNELLYRQGLVSVGKENTLIKNLTVTGEISAYQNLGGIIARNNGGKVINCVNQVSVQGDNQCGGIAGYNDGNIEKCINEQEITTLQGYAGGIGGTSTGIIKECVNKSKITGGYYVGGICGENYQTVEMCLNSAGISSSDGVIRTTGEAKNAFTGGITGVNEGTISKCINQGNISSVNGLTAGIAGRNYNTITYCCNKGDVIGDSVIGGIVGNNRGYVSYVYNISSEIKSNFSSTGGIIGNQNNVSGAYTKYAYNKSKVTGTSEVSGIMGACVTGIINNCYNIGTINASTATNVGQVYGTIYSTSAVTNSGSTTEVAMIGWNQATITTNIGNFVKKTNSLPILNITVNGVTF